MYTAVNIWFKSRTQLLSNFSQQKEIIQYLHINDEVFKFSHVSVAVLPWTWIRCLTYNNREIHMEPWNAKFNLSLEKKKTTITKLTEDRVIERRNYKNTNEQINWNILLVWIQWINKTSWESKSPFLYACTFAM